MKYNQKRNLIIAIVVFLAGILVGGSLLIDKNSQILNYYPVSSVIDGDTIKINKDQRIRLIGIDAPDKGECYYHTSTQALKELIEDKVVKLEKDITDKDDYGRLLRYVVLLNKDGDDILVNDYLIRKGFARTMAISPDTKYRDLLSSAQQEAYRNKLGMWGECNYELENQGAREVDTEPVDPKCTIKGNISEKGYGKTYLVPGCVSYESVKVDTRKGEQYFCSEPEAEDAGFRKAINCP
jgi:micrococcal nuclease